MLAYHVMVEMPDFDGLLANSIVCMVEFVKMMAKIFLSLSCCL